MGFNYWNWLALARALLVFENPFAFFWAIARRQAPSHVVVRTPIGKVLIHLRNFEALRTCFSIFCRKDYRTGVEPTGLVMDVGANIGIASLYFLSRNPRNSVV